MLFTTVETPFVAGRSRAHGRRPGTARHGSFTLQRFGMTRWRAWSAARSAVRGVRIADRGPGGSRQNRKNRSPRRGWPLRSSIETPSRGIARRLAAMVGVQAQISTKFSALCHIARSVTATMCLADVCIGRKKLGRRSESALLVESSASSIRERLHQIRPRRIGW